MHTYVFTSAPSKFFNNQKIVAINCSPVALHFGAKDDVIADGFFPLVGRNDKDLIGIKKLRYDKETFRKFFNSNL